MNKEDKAEALIDKTIAQKHAGGRPTVVTPAALAKLEEAFLMGCSDTEACFSAEISPSSLYRHQEENPEFRERKQALKSYPNYLARKTIYEAIQVSPEMAMKYAERKMKEEFSLRSEITGADGEEFKGVQTIFVPVGKDHEPSD